MLRLPPTSGSRKALASLFRAESSYILSHSCHSPSLDTTSISFSNVLYSLWYHTNVLEGVVGPRSRTTAALSIGWDEIRSCAYSRSHACRWSRACRWKRARVFTYPKDNFLGVDRTFATFVSCGQNFEEIFWSNFAISGFFAVNLARKFPEKTSKKFPRNWYQ